MMKKILIGLLAVVVLLVAVALVVPFLVPAERYKAEVTELVRTATGRELRIDGAARLTVLPSLGISLKQVTFANAPGGAAKDMVSLDGLDLKLKLFPLLSGRVEVDSFVLDRPVIALEVDAKGKPNWDIKPATAAAAPAAEPAAAPTGAPAASSGSSLGDVRLGDVRIVNGSLTYLDQRTGARQALDAIDVAVSLPGLDAPLGVKGNVTWNAKRIDLDLDVSRLRELLENRSSEVVLAIQSDPVSLVFKGSGGVARVMGTVDLNVPSVRDLAAWAGSPIAMAGTGLGPLSITGKLDVAGPKLSFTEASLALDAIRGTGSLTVDTGGRKPAIAAGLSLGELDLNPYLPPEAAGKAEAAPTPAPATGKSAGWSDEPIDLAGLKAVNANLALAVTSIKMRKITVGRSAVKVGLRDGRLAVDLTELELYQGKGKGSLVLDGSAAVPAIEASFTLGGIQVQPLLSDAAGFSRLEGGGATDIAISGRGASQRQIVGSLNGKGSFAFTDGAINGFNLAAMLRNVTTAFTAGAANEKTDFASLRASYQITNGTLKNEDLEMLAPLFRVNGAGTVDLPKRTVDYTITPKVVATAEGQGGAKDVGGVMVPVIVQGPWDNLSYRPDLAALLKQKIDPKKALDSLTGAGGAAPVKPKELLKGLLGN